MEEVMTQSEAVNAVELYRRERDDLVDRLIVASVYSWALEEEAEERNARFMRRPGIQNGLQKVEEMEAGQGSIGD